MSSNTNTTTDNTELGEAVVALVATHGGWSPKSDEAKDLLDVVRAQLDGAAPPLLWGDPGIGKTETIKSLAAAMGYHTFFVIGARKEATFLEGIPVVERPQGIAPNGKAFRPRTVNVLPDWFEFCLENPKTFLVFDEISGTTEDVQSGLLSFIQDREIDGVHLPDETRIIGAANRIDTAANGQYLAPPMANRWAHIDFNLPVSDWLDGLRQNFGKDVNLSKLDPESPTYAADVAAARDKHDRLLIELSRIAAYLNTNNGNANPPVPDDPEESGMAWTSRRTWTALAHALKNVDEDRRVVRDMIIRANIGLKTAKAFITWDNSFNLPPLEEILATADKVDWSAEETDAVYAKLSLALNFLNRDNLLDVVNLFEKAGAQHQGIGYAITLDLVHSISVKFGNTAENFALMGRLSQVFDKLRKAAQM